MQGWTEIETPHGPVRAWRAEPAGPSKGAVLVIQEIFGVNPHIRSVADRIQRLGHGRIDEAAGVDHHHVGRVIRGNDVVALGPQLGQDALGIDKGLRAAKADEADFGVQLGHGSQGLWGPGPMPEWRGDLGPETAASIPALGPGL